MELIADAAASYERLQSFRRRLGGREKVDPDVAIVEGFHAAMDDDFNTPVALGVLFDAVREGNRLADAGSDAASISAAVELILDVLGLIPAAGGLDDLAEPLDRLVVELGGESSDAASALEWLLQRRTMACSGQDWATSDKIRDQLGALGVTIEDGPDGVTWHRK